jgi:hypothetical protein
LPTCFPGWPPEKAWQFGSPPATLYTIAVVPDFPNPKIKTFIYFLPLNVGLFFEKISSCTDK